jgi:putative glutamine transport system substrate-binding protein
MYKKGQRYGMVRRLLLPTLLCFLLIFSAACSGTNSQNSSGGSEATEDKDSGSSSGSGTVNEGFVDEIKDRGFLIVGCKMDVPDLSFYDSETDTWSGLETELAWKTAAEIFGVSVDEAKDKKLVHFTGVTVADREEKLENGEVDCLFSTYTITKERAERFCLSNKYYTDYIGLMVRDSGEDSNSVGSADIHSVADLDGKYIGVPRNATTREDFLNYINTMNTITVSPIFCEYESYEALYTALLHGNIDVMSVDVSILKGYDTNKTKILKDRFAGQNYGAAVTKENAVLMDVINKVIEEQ